MYVFYREAAAVFSTYCSLCSIYDRKQPFETASLLTQLSHYKLLQNNAAKAQWKEDGLEKMFFWDKRLAHRKGGLSQEKLLLPLVQSILKEVEKCFWTLQSFYIRLFWELSFLCHWEKVSSNRQSSHGRTLAQTDVFNPIPCPDSLNNNQLGPFTIAWMESMKGEKEWEDIRG